MFKFLHRLFARDRQKDFLNQMAPGAIVTNSLFEDNVIVRSGEMFTVPDGQDLRGVTFKNNRVVAADTRPPLPRPANRIEEELRRRLASGDGA